MMLHELLTSFIKRPYVAAFLITYLIFAIRCWGILKTIRWLVICYLVAWISEVSSIRNGIPYGHYSYIYKNLEGELLILGVPFFDSLSYAFLIFASYGLAQKAWGNNITQLILGGAFFTMLIDVIIDPLATMGEKWFLGQIHEYKNPGYYFGVPASNFLGWYLVSAIAIALNLLVNRGPMPKVNNGPIILYTTISSFNIIVAYVIGEVMLATAMAAILTLALRITYNPKINF